MSTPLTGTHINQRRQKVFAQGDVLLLAVRDVDLHEKPGEDAAQPIILAHGEHTGHRHAFYRGALMFRDDALARDFPPELYIGHVKVVAGGALLEHGPGPGQQGDHDPIHVPAGTYVALRQREYGGGSHWQERAGERTLSRPVRD